MEITLLFSVVLEIFKLSGTASEQQQGKCSMTQTATKKKPPRIIDYERL